MIRFTDLFRQIDETTKTNEKVLALKEYFADAPPKDATWALYFLLGEKLSRAVTSTQLRQWVSEYSKLPLWIVEECYDRVGDLAETLALLLPEPESQSDIELHRLVETVLIPLKKAEELERKDILLSLWKTHDRHECFLIHKLLTGGLRVGVSKALVTRALAALHGFSEPEMAHRLTGTWNATEENYSNLIDPKFVCEGPGNPYPFFLAYPLESATLETTLGKLAEWHIEWKWDGIRAQLLKRDGELMIWSRGEEAITESYPELTKAMEVLPDGVVLDGELIGWKKDKPLAFGELQRRLQRKRVSKKLLEEVPVKFIAYDLLQLDGQDLRETPLTTRVEKLNTLMDTISSETFLPSIPIHPKSFEELRELRGTARERLTEGFMLKQKDSPYGVGRKRGVWWKWKVDPLTIDAVLLYAQKGRGRRAGLFSDYTFGIWDDGKLVTVAKAYSGLTDKEIRSVDKYIKSNTVERFGPVRAVTPKLVFEIGFDDIRESKRHKSGFALRFPRMLRQRLDKPPEQADTKETVEALLRSVHGENLSNS